MSQEVRSRGGLPLFIGGKVAGASKCCDCDTQPCICSDYCPYNVEVVYPSYLAIKSGYGSCGGANSSTSPSSRYAEIECSPIGWTASGPPLGEELANADEASAAINYYGDNLGAGIASHTRRIFERYTKQFPSNDFLGSTLLYSLGGFANIGLRVYCDNSGLSPRYFASIFFTLQINVYVPFTGAIRFHRAARQADYELSSYCSKPGTAICNNTSSRVGFINSPVSITANGSTTSFGPYQLEGFPFSSRQEMIDFAGQEVMDYFDCLSDFFSATFRITSRPSCKEVSCSCFATLAGCVFTYRGVDYFVGTPVDPGDGIVRVSFDGYGILMCDHIDDQGRMVTREYVNIFCLGSKWYAEFITVCITYAEIGLGASQTDDTYMGEFICYEACSDEFRDAGDTIPLGEPQNVTYLGRNGNSCEPPARTTVSIRQAVTC